MRAKVIYLVVALLVAIAGPVGATAAVNANPPSCPQGTNWDGTCV